MKNSSYKSYDELPLFLNAETTAIGTRLVVPREKFREWVEQNVGK